MKLSKLGVELLLANLVTSSRAQSEDLLNGQKVNNNRVVQLSCW